MFYNKSLLCAFVLLISTVTLHPNREMLGSRQNSSELNELTKQKYNKLFTENFRNQPINENYRHIYSLSEHLANNNKLEAQKVIDSTNFKENEIRTTLKWLGSLVSSSNEPRLNNLIGQLGRMLESKLDTLVSQKLALVQ